MFKRIGDLTLDGSTTEEFNYKMHIGESYLDRQWNYLEVVAARNFLSSWIEKYRAKEKKDAKTI